MRQLFVHLPHRYLSARRLRRYAQPQNQVRGGRLLVKLPLRLSHVSAVARFLLSVPLVNSSNVALAESPIGSDPDWLDTMGNTLFFVAQPDSIASADSDSLFTSDRTAADTT